MAAIEISGPFDADAFLDYLCAQDDLGTKAIPRFLRVSTNLPVTGSNKVLKRELQQQRWDTTDEVYRWAGRGAPRYRRMTDDDKRSLDAEFAQYGRRRYL